MRRRPDGLGDRSWLIGVAALAVMGAGFAAKAGGSHESHHRDHAATSTTLACRPEETTSTTAPGTPTTSTTTTTTTTVPVPSSDVTTTTTLPPCEPGGPSTTAGTTAPSSTPAPSTTTNRGGTTTATPPASPPAAAPASAATTTTTPKRPPAPTATTIAEPDVPTPSLPPKPPTDWPVRPIVFPVAGPVTYYDDWGACRGGPLCPRRHIGNDLIGQRLQPLLAARDGLVTHLVLNNPTAGWGLVITDADGWDYRYYHVNDDTPGTDDHANPVQWRLAPGIKEGSHVKAGQLVAYLGDSGNAEMSVPHVHFEIHLPDGSPIDPYRSLRFSEYMARCSAQSAPAVQAESAFMPPVNTTLADAIVRTSTGRGTFLLSLDGSVLALGDARSVGWSRNAASDPPCPPAAPARPVAVVVSPSSTVAPAQLAAAKPVATKPTATKPAGNSKPATNTKPAVGKTTSHG